MIVQIYVPDVSHDCAGPFPFLFFPPMPKAMPENKTPSVVQTIFTYLYKITRSVAQIRV